ncbi:MAG TPA: c-type cytochrome domain-containing protein, partial [Candidatus Limnocylindria bacterium]|nr:c-type cytochrome domain-containing protein [Candidatus Limnocylindria bacterium]
MKLNCLFPTTMLALAPALLIAAEPIDFNKQVKPILEQNCVRCHGSEQGKGSLRLHTKELAITGGDGGPALIVGKSKDSSLYTTTILPADDDKAMPPQPKNKPLTKEQTEVLKAWIDEGAKWPAGVSLAAVKQVDFVKDIQPILEFNCVACHREGHSKGGLRLDEKMLAFKGGDGGPGIVPGKLKESLVYTSTTVDTNDDGLMPPLNKNGPLPKEEIELLAGWIEQGASWPDGLRLTPRKKEEAAGNELTTVADIHKQLTAKVDAATEAEMKAYTNTIPGTQVSYSMTPIKGGEFVMGSPAPEAGRKPDESPQHKVKIEPFWMGVCEVTWSEYELFMYQDEERKFQKEIVTDPYVDKISDAVSRPTKPYVEMSFGMGKEGYPAISMTHHAANKYCEWLSA